MSSLPASVSMMTEAAEAGITPRIISKTNVNRNLFSMENQAGPHLGISGVRVEIFLYATLKGMLTRRSLLLSMAAYVPLALAEKKKEGKPPEVELAECSVKRQADLIVLDGRVRNISEKPIKRLVIFFDFLSSEQKVLTTKRGEIDAEILAPGEDAEFHSQIEPPARATHYQINFEDGAGRNLRGLKVGPFPIE